MHRLTHFPLCPHSRSIRLALCEQGIEFDLIEERAWEYRAPFLALNPAGELPVLETKQGEALCGAYSIMEYLAEAPADASQRPGPALLPQLREDRAEVRRVVDWFHRKFDREVTRELLAEKVYPRLTPGLRHTPSPDLLRAVRANMRYHLRYVSFLADQRSWLGGDTQSFADLAAAAHLSVADYLDEVPWEQHPTAKAWYQRVKSRPSFRELLADRIPGFPPPRHYADLDF